MTTTIIIFGKTPIAGYAKTRLLPALGADGAADVAKQLLQRTVAAAVAADLGPVILAVTPEMTHPVWAELNLSEQIVWEEQIEGDLGERLAHAAQKALRHQQRVLLAGTDCPELRAETFREAAAQLASADVSMIPVTDGGYALIGLRQFDASLFTGIPWSTSDVAATTREICYRLGWSIAEMPVMHDIDEPDDLRWLTD